MQAEARVDAPPPDVATEADLASRPLASLAQSEPVPAPVVQPVQAEPIVMPAPVVDVEKALEESGLILIQTDPSKVTPPEPVAETQFVPAAPRPRRPPPADSGPLQIVETKK